MLLKLTFKFDAAHRLMHHKGQCHHIHGHTWKVEVALKGEPDKETGMIVDFANVKERMMNHVLGFFDHATIINYEDFVVKAFLKKQGFKYMEILDGEPTCENLAKMIYQQAKVAVPQKLYWVQVWESENASAVYDEGEEL